jgi:acyl carrier protein
MLIELEDVRRTVGLVLGRRDPAADARLKEDLGAESMDLLNIMVTLEEKHDVSIGEAAMAEVSSVRELYQLLLKSPRAGEPTARPA